MKLYKLLKNFRKDEDGAVTVDWVVLTAAIVGLGFLVITLVVPGMQTLAERISEEVSITEIGVPGGGDGSGSGSGTGTGG